MNRHRFSLMLMLFLGLGAFGCSTSSDMPNAPDSGTDHAGRLVATANGDEIVIDFDLDPLGNPIPDETHILNEYEPWGALFRDRAGSFYAPLGESPGEAEADEDPFSPPNVLESEDDEGDGVWVLFESPVMTAGAFVRGEQPEEDDHGDEWNDDDGDDDSGHDGDEWNDDDGDDDSGHDGDEWNEDDGDDDSGHDDDEWNEDDGDDDSDDDGDAQVIYIEAYDADSVLIGAASVTVDEESGWVPLSFSSDQPISSVRFFSQSIEDEEEDDSGQDEWGDDGDDDSGDEWSDDDGDHHDDEGEDESGDDEDDDEDDEGPEFARFYLDNLSYIFVPDEEGGEGGPPPGGGE